LARDNYSYKKYQRELSKKKKKEEKMQRKIDKKNAQPEETTSQVTGDLAANAPKEQPLNGNNNKVQ